MPRPRREDAPDARGHPRPGSGAATTGGPLPPLPPARLPAPRPRPRPHRVVELGDGRHDGVVVLAPVHLRAASPQLVPPVRDAHGRGGASGQPLPQPPSARATAGSRAPRPPLYTRRVSRRMWRLPSRPPGPSAGGRACSRAPPRPRPRRGPRRRQATPTRAGLRAARGRGRRRRRPGPRGGRWRARRRGAGGLPTPAPAQTPWRHPLPGSTLPLWTLRASALWGTRTHPPETQAPPAPRPSEAHEGVRGRTRCRGLQQDALAGWSAGSTTFPCSLCTRRSVEHLCQFLGHSWSPGL